MQVAMVTAEFLNNRAQELGLLAAPPQAGNSGGKEKGKEREGRKLQGSSQLLGLRMRPPNHRLQLLHNTRECGAKVHKDET